MEGKTARNMLIAVGAVVVSFVGGVYAGKAVRNVDYAEMHEREATKPAVMMVRTGLRDEIMVQYFNSDGERAFQTLEKYLNIYQKKHNDDLGAREAEEVDIKRALGWYKK